MFEQDAEEYFRENAYNFDEVTACRECMEFGYNKANEWFDARMNIPLPKKAEIYRYTLEVISDKGDIVCFDYKDKSWKKLIIEDEKVIYVPVEIKMWCNKPVKESVQNAL